MRLSYENDISKLREGTRGRIFQQILSEMILKEDNGEFFIDTPADKLGTGIFKFGQAVTRLHDITFRASSSKATKMRNIQLQLLGKPFFFSARASLSRCQIF